MRGMTDAAELQRSLGYLRLHAVEVFVRDQERSLRFYVDQLGFKLAFDVRLESGKRWVTVAPPDGGAVLSLIAPSPRSPDYKKIGRVIPVVFVTEDVPAKFHDWRSRGVRFSGTPRLRRVRYEGGQRHASGVETPLEETDPAWGGVFTRFLDVDGNTFRLVSFDVMSRAIEAQRRAAEEKLEAERRAAHELEIARQVQARLFPQRLPQAATLEYAGLCIQARHVGGDYYDFLSLGRDRLGLVIADIAGKGMPAALLMANLQANLRSQCAMALDEPERFLCSVNQLFRESAPDSAYATLLYAEYDDNTQRLRYANCGHLHGLLLRTDGGLDRLQTTATVLGFFDHWECAIQEYTLRSGDLLILYTDGVTESFNASGDEFGEERLLDGLRRRRNLPAASLLDSLVDEVRRFSPDRQYDDITMIVARCRTAA
jgi:serine phosphatase RsbU (regulator of sigma subunit)/catechol 2,3-dioxygenase-like lactoylglutathione lyase family enzyme